MEYNTNSIIIIESLCDAIFKQYIFFKQVNLK